MSPNKPKQAQMSTKQEHEQAQMKAKRVGMGEWKDKHRQARMTTE